MPLPRPSLSSQQKASPLLAPITPAEERVLTLLRRGDSNRAIAERLVLSPRTVESHVSRLLAKTGCRNRTQLTLWSQSHA
jgi:DNA-binding NarL/FixJ family response regulator